jgi:HK97 family phage portal protein
MAENIIKRALKSITTKGVTQNAQSGSGSNGWAFIDTYFSWILGKGGAFGKYTKAYGENPLVYMVVNKIAKTTASLKRVIVLADGSTSDTGRIFDILNKPNDDDDEIEFRTKINEYLLLTGNAFIKLIRGEGMGQSLEVLVTQKVCIVCNTIGEVIRYDYTLFDGTIVPYDFEDILHIKTSNVVNVDNTQSKYGLSPLQSAWIVVTSSMEKLKADASIFKSRGIIGILSSDGDTPMLDPERERLQEGFDKDTGGANKFNKIHITSSKLRFLQTGMSPSDLKLLEGILSSLRLICGVYGMPSVLFNDTASSTYNNVSEAKITAYTDVYIPLDEKVNKELSRWLGEKLGFETILVVDKKSIDVLKSSTNEVSQSLSNVPTNVAQRAVEALTVDETREHILGLGKAPIGGDELMGKSGGTNDKNGGDESK